MKYNQIYDIYVVEDGSGSSSGMGLNADHFTVTAGDTSFSDSSLIGATIQLAAREGIIYELVTGTPSNDEYNFNSSTGTLTFATSFNSGEKVYVLWVGNGTSVTAYEPVTLTEMKDYLRLEGFISEAESTASVDFDDDDSFIRDLITSARETIEAVTGRAVIPKTLRVLLTNNAGRSFLPYPPIGDITSLVDEDDVEILAADYSVIGSDIKYLKSPCYEYMTITYECGYSTPKAWVKDAIKKEVAHRYFHRGDEFDDGLCKASMAIVKPFIVKSWLV